MSSDPVDSTAKTKRRREKKSFLGRTWFGKARSGDVFFACLIFLIIILIFIVQPARIFELLVNRYAGLILIIMIIEYMVLKSMDRTKVYERECQKLREKLREQKRVVRKARSLLEEATTTEIKDGTEDKVRWETRAEDCVKEIDGV